MRILLFVACLLATTVVTAQELSKEETLKYIEKLFRANYDDNESTVTHFAVEGKTLAWKTSSGVSKRIELVTFEFLKVTDYDYNGQKLYSVKGQIKDEAVNIFTAIRLDSDANRLKKALEHLIGLLKKEKNTDPFDN